MLLHKRFILKIFRCLLIIIGVKHLQWITFMDSEGRVTDSEALRKRVFYGGLDHELQNEVCVLHM